MSAFSEEHAAVLRELLTTLEPARFIVIGAAAISIHIDFTWRSTQDLDLCVASDVTAYAPILERLGWHRDRDIPHRWRTPGGFRVDVLPGHPDLVRRGEVIWPESGARMSLVGFRLAFADAVAHEIGPGKTVQVASVPALFLLKIAAYLDRPWERESDLADLAHILHGWLSSEAPERWDDKVIALGLDYDDVGPFLLGRRLGARVDAKELEIARRFLAKVEDRADAESTLNRMAQRAPHGWRDPDRLQLRIHAFRRGFFSGS